MSYTAQITRSTPTAFIFLVDQSISTRHPCFFNEEMPMSEAIAQIVNKQLFELVKRCVKLDDVRHYFDIAVIGYGHEVHSAWKGNLEGRWFVSPKELNDNPYKKIICKELVKLRRGTELRDVERVQWVEGNHEGKWTHLYAALDMAKELLIDWIAAHGKDNCYPPTVINITDGIFNHGIGQGQVLSWSQTLAELTERANFIKNLCTKDGNVLFFNIHVTSGKESENGGKIICPVSKDCLFDTNNAFSNALFDISSTLPSVYSARISELNGDHMPDALHKAFAINADMATLVQLMDIGTPTNISINL